MEIDHSTQDGCVIVGFTGTIDLLSVSAVQRTLLKELAEQPDGLICDLSGVDHLDPVCATVFATVVNHPASRWPATGFALCGAQPQVAEVLGRLQVPDFLPVHPSVDQALDAVFDRPPYLRGELLLAPTPTAPAAVHGRRFRSGGPGWAWVVAGRAARRRLGVNRHPGGGKVVWCTLKL